MMAATQNAFGSVLSAVALVGFYAVAFWRIFKRNQGNRVIECGSIALVLFFVMGAVMKLPQVPDWVVPGLGILFLLLGFLMIFFLVQQGYNAIRRKRQN